MKKLSSIFVAILVAAILAGCSAFRTSGGDKDIARMEKRLAETYEEIEALYRSISETLALIARQEIIIREIEATLAKQKIKPAVSPATVEKPAGEKAETGTAGTPSPKGVYNLAMSAFDEADYKRSVSLFEQFIRDFPSHDLADNALYWKGECFYSEKEYQKAINIFNTALKNYPKGNKASDSLLKIGYAYMSLDDRQNARIFLEKVVSEHPGSASAAKAAERLKSWFRQA